MTSSKANHDSYKLATPVVLSCNESNWAKYRTILRIKTSGIS